MTDPQEKGARSRTEGSRKKNGRGRRKGIVARTARATENVHRTVAGLPLDLLERIGRLKRPVARVRKLQDRSITATYDMLRGVNREVVELLREARGEKEPKRRKARTIHHPKPVGEAAHARRAAHAAS
jgi:hypothetical protein